LTSGRSLKFKNMKKKKEISFAVLKPNERELFRIPLELMTNKSRYS
jgi:hypothetical protein